MQQFALASLYPRSIAWLIRPDEWNRFERIIEYNCAMVGGYFNIFVPLTELDTIDEQYQSLLADYDPDIVVLAPGMTEEYLNICSVRPHPFGIIPWEKVSQIALSDPWSGSTGANATLGSKAVYEIPKGIIKVATASDEYVDVSRLALLVCGDVKPRTPLLDDEMDLDATGHREIFLEKVLKPEYHRQDVEAQLNEGFTIRPAPDRYRLTELIQGENQFPLSHVSEILKTCFRLQHHVNVYQSFIGLTAMYKLGYTSRRKYDKNYPAVVILTSEHFELRDALLFWNLRASGVYIAWLPFSYLQHNTDEIVQWLEYNYGGEFYAIVEKTFDMAFACSAENINQIQDIVNNLQVRRQKTLPVWSVIKYDDLTFYNYIKPCITREQVMVVNDHQKYFFIPKLLTAASSGEHVVTLQWDGCMLPQHDNLQPLLSSETIRGFVPWQQEQSKTAKQAIVLPRFRITNERYLQIQLHDGNPIEFTRPSTEQIVKTIFTASGFARLEPSSVARYHTNFIQRCGNLNEAVHYLANSPYRQCFELLSDNAKKGRPGWILDSPSKRRVLHHIHLWEVLGEALPDKTKKYFDTVSDQLPTEIITLLNKSLLERGFRLKCDSCSFRSWYPTEQVGQTFICSRCFQQQVYSSNPLWLYKLPEVIFQGFEDNMHVPLLTLGYMQRTSKHAFEWVPDSDVYGQIDDPKALGNIDIICIRDGRLYVGEAKSNDEIDTKQFSFYEDICRRVPIDGIIFATSQSHWGRGTLQRIDSLKFWFHGEVIILTEKHLYSTS